MKVVVKRAFCKAVPVLSILALSSCGHGEQQGVEPIIVDTTLVGAEKVMEQVGEAASKVEAQPMAPSCPAKNTTPSSRHDDTEDNLRGFDPASEDDMPDNGMRHYMENDDEEGWD